METTRSFPLVRTAVTSLPAADKLICHEVIKRHVLCLQELAPGFVPPKPEAAHPPRRQTMAIVCCTEQGWGDADKPFRPPKCQSMDPMTPQRLQSLQRKCKSWQCVTQRSTWGSIQHPRTGPHSQGVYVANPCGDTAHEPRVISQQDAIPGGYSIPSYHMTNRHRAPD